MPDRPSWYKGNLDDFSTKGAVPQIPKDKNGNIDWGQFVRDSASDIVPAATTALVPEVAALSPLKNLLMKMGISFAGGTGVDQLLNIGQDKPILNSAVDSAANTGLGIGLPELLNLGINLKNPTRTSTTTRGPSTSERTSISNREGISNTNSERTGTSNNQIDSSSIAESQGSSKGSSLNYSQGESSHTGTAKTLGLSETEAKSLGFQPSDVVTRTIRIDPKTKKFVKAYDITETIPREGQYQTNSDSITNSENNTSSEGLTKSNRTGGGNNERTSSGLNSRVGNTRSLGNTSGSTVSSGTSGGTTQSTGTTVNIPGISQTTRDTAPPGMMGHILELLNNLESYKRVRPNGTPIVNPIQSALMGLGINLGADATINRPQQQQ